MKEDKAVNCDVEDIEVALLVEAIYRRYGYDFRDYSRVHIKRRVKYCLVKYNMKSISFLQHEVLHNQSFFSKILKEFSINVTEMFRDPDFFSFIRKEVSAYLQSYPRIKIWHAGCSSGEEVYSMAILLKEEGLYNRSMIYATDFNDAILKVATEGIYPIESIREYTRNYINAGGKQAFSDYYTASNDSVIMLQELKENISFANHNLVTDQVFGEMDIIICRNVLIYFNRDLQNAVQKLFYNSLSSCGCLCLGTKETIAYSEFANCYNTLSETYRIYRKKRFLNEDMS